MQSQRQQANGSPASFPAGYRLSQPCRPSRRCSKYQLATVLPPRLWCVPADRARKIVAGRPVTCSAASRSWRRAILRGVCLRILVPMMCTKSSRHPPHHLKARARARQLPRQEKTLRWRVARSHLGCARLGHTKTCRCLPRKCHQTRKEPRFDKVVQSMWGTIIDMCGFSACAIYRVGRRTG